MIRKQTKRSIKEVMS